MLWVPYGFYPQRFRAFIAAPSRFWVLETQKPVSSAFQMATAFDSFRFCCFYSMFGGSCCSCAQLHSSAWPQQATCGIPFVELMDASASAPSSGPAWRVLIWCQWWSLFTIALRWDPCAKSNRCSCRGLSDPLLALLRLHLRWDSLNLHAVLRWLTTCGHWPEWRFCSVWAYIIEIQLIDFLEGLKL